MTSEFHKQQLEKIMQFLVFNDWDTTYEIQDVVHDYDRLVVKIYTAIENEQRFWPLELSFLPGLEQDLDGFSIMQCYVPVIASVPAALNLPLAEMITQINTKLVLGSFGLLTPMQILFYKHNTIFSITQLTMSYPVIEEMISMVSYLLTNFNEAFSNVVTGKMTTGEAMRAMPFKDLYK
jgi:hypothetical protein